MSRRTGVVVAVVAACVAVDVLVVGVPLTIFLLAVAALVRGTQWLVSVMTGRREKRALRGRRALTFAGAVALIYAGLVANSLLARARAATIAGAVKAYRARSGDYPRRLEELVPEFLPAIPPSCIRLTMRKFGYRYAPAESPHPRLTWIWAPPRGFGEYLFERDEIVLVGD